MIVAPHPRFMVQDLTEGQRTLLGRIEDVRADGAGDSRFPFLCPWHSGVMPAGTRARGVHFEGCAPNTWHRLCCTDAHPCFHEYDAQRLYNQLPAWGPHRHFEFPRYLQLQFFVAYWSVEDFVARQATTQNGIPVELLNRIVQAIDARHRITGAAVG